MMQEDTKNITPIVVSGNWRIIKMNKQEALLILNDLKQNTDGQQFITSWYNYDERSLTYNNDVNEAIDTVSKYPDLSTIALEIDDHFISDLKDWYSEIY